MHVLKRHEEAEQSRFQNAVEIGLENVKWLDGMRQWCSHFEMTQTTFGMYAEQTQLPIASFRVGCPKVAGGGGSEGMHLSWSCSAFLEEHCDGCELRDSNGDSSWAQNVIDELVEARKQQELNIADRDAKIKKLRSDLKSRSAKIKEKADSVSTKVVTYLETIFDGDEANRRLATVRLIEAAKIAADLFPDEAIQLICELSGMQEFAADLLPVASVLANKCKDHDEMFAARSIANIGLGLEIELSSALLSEVAEHAAFPLNEKEIKSLLVRQEHGLFAVHHGGKDFKNATSVLIRCLDVDEKAVRKPILEFLRSSSDIGRFQLCGAIRLIQKDRPKFVLLLLDALLEALTLVEGETQNPPSRAIVRILQNAFRQSPDLIDSALAKLMSSQRPAVGEDIVNVYRKLLLGDYEDRRRVRSREEIQTFEKVAFARVLDWIKDDSIDLEVRVDALEVLEFACEYASAEALVQFDSLLGYYALICKLDGPPPEPPKIVLPDDPPEDPQLKQLKKSSRIQYWGFFKQRLRQSLANLCEALPKETFDSVAGCLQNPTADLGDEFKACCISLLGQLGKDYLLRSQVLPILMKGLMDYDFSLVRATAIDALVEVFSHSNASPPANMIDTIIVHLRDTYVIVHKSALQAIRRRPSWFNEAQAIEVLRALPAHLQCYGDRPYQLDDICDAILGIGGRSKGLRLYALRQVESIFPTNEKLVDQKIVEEILRYFAPDDALAPIVAKIVAVCLSHYDRDRYNTDERRIKSFRWLQSQTADNFQSVATDILREGKLLASKSGWESTQFAAVFANFESFDAETEVLTKAIESIPDEPRTDDVRGMINSFRLTSFANSSLKRGDVASAERSFDEVWSIIDK